MHYITTNTDILPSVYWQVDLTTAMLFSGLQCLTGNSPPTELNTMEIFSLWR